MARFKKGSAAAKAYMAKLRSMVGKKRKPYMSEKRHIPTVKHMGKAKKTYRYIKRKIRRSKSKAVPILPIVGLGVTFYEPLKMAAEGRFEDALNVAATRFGWDNWSQRFNITMLINGMLPIFAGTIGHFVASKLGVNRALHKIPIVGKYISL